MKRIRILLIVSLASILAACGSDTGKGEAPPGATIAMSPDAVEWNVTAGSPLQLLRQAYIIHVSTAGGGDVRDAHVQVFLDLADGTINPGGPIMFLMDKDGNPLTSPYETKTDSFGNINVLVDFFTGGVLEYAGNLQAFSGGAFGLSSITVNCVDTATLKC